MIKLRPYQQELVKQVKESARKGKRRIIAVCPTGCHEKGYKIMLSTGELECVENIQVGDILMGPNGEHKNVLELHHGIDDMYKIIPVNGEPFVVNGGHILSLYITRSGHKYQCQEPYYLNLSVNDYIKKSKTFKHKAKLYRSKIDFNEKEVPIDPWCLGFLIGDGCLSRDTPQISICELDKKLFELLNYEANKFDCYLTLIKSNKTGCKDFRIRGFNPSRSNKNKIKEVLVNLGLNVKSGEKFIPDIYKYNSVKIRNDILCGLLDSDAHYNGKGFDYISKSERLSEDVVFLSRSLGLKAQVKKCKKSCQNGYSNYYYRVCISGNLEILNIRSERRVPSERRQIKNPLVTGFKVEHLGKGEYFGFTIDGDNLYLGHDFIVHHNSGKSACIGEIVNSILGKRNRVIVVLPRRSLVRQLSKSFSEWGIKHGVVMSGHKCNRRLDDCQIISVDTYLNRMANGRMKLIDADVLIIDEVQLQHSDKKIKIFDNYKFVISFTATPVAPGGKPLGTFYDDIVEVISMKELTEQGYLAPLKYYSDPSIDLTGLKVDKTGDYREKEMDSVMNKKAMVGDIVKNWRRIAENRPTVVFASTQAHARALCESFNLCGFSFEYVDCLTPDDERQAIFDRVASGKTIGICNYSIIGVGIDIPCLEVCVLARPTRLISNYLQMVGRVTRLYPGKSCGYVIDHARIIENLGFADDEHIWTLDGKETVEERTKKVKEERKEPKEIICKDCGTVFKSRRSCPVCGCEMVKSHEEIPCYDVELKEVKVTPIDKSRFYSELLGYCRRNGKSDSYALAIFKEKFKQWPYNKFSIRPTEPSQETLNYVKSRQIAYAKRKSVLV